MIGKETTNTRIIKTLFYISISKEINQKGRRRISESDSIREKDEENKAEEDSVKARKIETE